MLAETLSDFFDADGIGDSVTIAGSAVEGLFESRYVEINNVEGYYPTFLCAASETAAVNSALVFDSTTYVIISRRPYEKSLILLILEEL